MYESLLVSIVREMGGPVAIISLLGLLAWVVLLGLLVAALLGMALSECRPWLPTDPGPETKPGGEWLEDTLWAQTQPMPLYGSQGLVGETKTMEDDLTAPTGPRTVAGRTRSAWLDD